MPVLVENILDMKNNKTTIIIGTFFKEQQKKPTILENIMNVIPTADEEPGAFVTTAKEIEECSQTSDKDKIPERDVGVLEDRSGRITITEGDNF